MINSKLEKLIFVFIFIIMHFVAGPIATQIKFDNITINKDLTPEQYIESKYGEINQRNLDYKYIIKNGYLFALINKLKNNEDGYLIQAFKGEKSGFMDTKDLPGFKFLFGYDVRMGFVDLPNGKTDSLIVSEFKSDYIIKIYDYYKEDNIEFYINEKKMDVLTFDDIKDSYWIEVLTDLSQDVEIYGMYNGEKFHVINTQEIKAWFGVK